MAKKGARSPQFEIHRQLSEMGIRCEAEVRLPATSTRSRSGHFYVDLAVFRASRIVAVCECKSKRRPLAGRQLENYEGCGVPYIVAGNETIDEAVAWLASHIKGA